MTAKKIRAVVFDMDGVLVDARDWHFEALNAALSLFGHSISRYDHLVTYDGLPTRKKLEMLSSERRLPRRLHAFINEMKQAYTLRIIHEKCRPSFVQEYALSKLRADGYRLAVASNSIRQTIALIMQYTNLEQYLDLTLSNEDVIRAKPDPEIYRMAIERLEVAPDECLVVEDNVNGVRAAQAAGAHVLEVKNPSEANYDNVRFRIRQCERGEA